MVGQSNVQIRALLDGVVALLMHGEGEDSRLELEGPRGPVALVHVEIHDGSSLDLASFDQNSKGDDDVVNRAEALPLPGEGVVEATAEIGRKWPHAKLLQLQRRAAGREGARGHRVEAVQHGARTGRLELVPAELGILGHGLQAVEIDRGVS
jgi:hypothetical protein